MNTTTLPPHLTLNINLTDEQFFQLCQNNRDLRFERTAAGELIIMPPTGSDTGNRNFDIAVELGIWNKQTKLGKGFDSSTGFKLPNGKESKSLRDGIFDFHTPIHQRHKLYSSFSEKIFTTNYKLKFSRNVGDNLSIPVSL
ncbi:hypothetical protein NIES806_19170 [Dolichospermum compactum NIES-806]|jgi:hypothetical protein|uniref:Putative restriction endonuclease domain-containing protein n=1 Tax=Dolichospermum compactum NIES-806 TaxID=1973481 RepID=A0A1Z4V2P7_9CYAN|nr:hypothetical protein NIES806_19170 [Dolichospermum compactum NIES-806]